MEDQVQYRIGWLGGCLVLSIAIVGDLLQILLSLTVVLALADDIVTVIAEGLIFIFFWIRGVRFLKGKRSTGRVIAFIITTFIEMIPIIDALPTLTIDTIYNIHSSRKEDRELFKQKQEERAAQAAAEEKQENEQLSQWAYYEAYAQKEAAERQEEVSGELENA